MSAPKNDKLLLAGASLPIAEGLVAMMHGGPIGAIVALGVSGLVYVVADELEQHRGEEISLPRPAHKERQSGEPGALYKMFNGKSVREEGEDVETARTEKVMRRARAGNPYALELAPDYKPHINNMLGRCILGVGQRGTGKSNVAARLIEQMGRFPIPMFIGDYKQDYITLPSVLERCAIAGAPDWPGQRECDTYWKLTKENAFKAGHYLMQKGVQLVFECLTYKTLDDAAEVMTLVLEGMFAWATQQSAGKRVPALVLLDEAQQFLPQDRADSRIDPDISAKLFVIFEKLNSVGRSLGLTPAIFTQRIAQIRKEVIGGSEIFFLMRQTLPQDLKVYEELIGRDEKGKARLERRQVQELGQGYGIIYENGDFFITHFDKRESEHLSTTPELENALAFYEGRRIDIAFNPNEELRPNLNQRSFGDLYKELMDEDADDGFSGSGVDDDEAIEPQTETLRGGQQDGTIIKPVIKEKGPKAEDLDINILCAVWNGGANSVAKLEQLFKMSHGEAYKAWKRIQDQLKLHDADQSAEEPVEE